MEITLKIYIINIEIKTTPQVYSVNKLNKLKININ